MPRKSKKNTTPTTPIRLNAEQLATLRSALDSWLYESAPEDYRESGNVLDPRDPAHVGALTIEDRGVISLIEEHDALEAILIAAEKALNESGAASTTTDTAVPTSPAAHV